MKGLRTRRTRGVRRGLAVFAVGGLALVASSCGGDDDDSAGSPDTASESTSAPDPTASESTEPGSTTPDSAGGPVTTGSSGGSGEPVVGVTDTSIKISVSLPATGPFSAALTKPYVNGIETWAAEVNAEGGINGRQIELVKVDNLFPATDGGVAACKEIESNDSFMVIAPANGVEEIDCLDEAGIPTFWFAPDTMNADWNNVAGGLYGLILSPIQVSFWQSSYLTPDVKKVGIVCQCYHPVGESTGKALADEAASLGIETVTVDLEPNQTSYVALVTRLKEADAELVMLTGYAEGAAIIRAADSIDYHPVWTASASSGTTLDAIAQAAGGAFDGMHSLMYLTSSDTPAFQDYIEKVRTVHGDDAAASADSLDLVNYGFSVVVGEMLTQAGPDLTRESFATAMKSIDNFDSGYLVPFTTLGKDVPVGVWSLFPAECCSPEGTFQVVGPAQDEF